MSNDNLQIKGSVVIEKDGEIVLEKNNLVMDTSIEKFIRSIDNNAPSTIVPVTLLGIGGYDLATPPVPEPIDIPTPTDTVLQRPLFTGSWAFNTALNVVDLSNKSITFTHTFAPTEDGITYIIQESGLFYVSGGNQLFSRIAFNNITKGPSNELVIYWSIVFGNI